MLQNTRITIFTVAQLLRKNYRLSTQIRVNVLIYMLQISITDTQSTKEPFSGKLLAGQFFFCQNPKGEQIQIVKCKIVKYLENFHYSNKSQSNGNIDSTIFGGLIAVVLCKFLLIQLFLKVTDFAAILLTLPIKYARIKNIKQTIWMTRFRKILSRNLSNNLSVLKVTCCNMQYYSMTDTSITILQRKLLVFCCKLICFS